MRSASAAGSYSGSPPPIAPGMLSCRTLTPFGVAASWSIAPYADSPAKAVDVPATLPLGVAALDPLMRRIVPAPCSSMPGSTCRTAAENPEY